MKKNLIFALSVFLITIVGLLVFTDSSNNSKKENLKVEKINQLEVDETKLLSLSQ